MDSLTNIRIGRIDAADERLRPLLEAHLAHSWTATPQTSNHTLDASDLGHPDIRLWAVFDGETVVGCGALKKLGDNTAEVKSVHVVEAVRGRGFARHMMDHLAGVGRADGLEALVLETGSDLLPEYDAARGLYHRLGYQTCGVIPGYQPDPNSVFLRLGLESGG